jgi:hypothetical protein
VSDKYQLQRLQHEVNRWFNPPLNMKEGTFIAITAVVTFDHKGDVVAYSDRVDTTPNLNHLGNGGAYR